MACLSIASSLLPLSPSFSVASRGSPFWLPNSLSFTRSSPSPKQRRGALTVVAARVGGVEIPNNKRIEFSLQYIHGIGRTLSRQILRDLGMENKFTRDLTDEELIKLRGELSNYMIEGELRRYTFFTIEYLKLLRCYRGIRHIRGLPCRGQKTRKNCRTLKGRAIPVAGKKKATKTK